jgi:hypothetical protein
MMKTKRQIGVIAIIVVFLVILLSILLLVRQKEMSLSEGLQITAGGEDYFLTGSDFSDIRMSSLPATGTEELRGYLITDIMETLALSIPEGVNYYFSTRDGNRLVISEEEIREKQAALMPESKDNNRFRLVLPHDPFRNRWLKDIVRIEIY